MSGRIYNVFKDVEKLLEEEPYYDKFTCLLTETLLEYNMVINNNFLKEGRKKYEKENNRSYSDGSMRCFNNSMRRFRRQ